MELVVAGGTGFLGGALCARLRAEGHTVFVLSRRAGDANTLVWDEPARWEPLVAQADAVLNLAGESVAGARWNPVVKERLRQSRLEPTRRLVAARPKVLVNASATGLYGDHGDRLITEETPPASDFFGKLCAEWEAAAQSAEATGTRVVLLRFGQVLARGGGALEAMLHPPHVPFSPWALGVGGPLGSGKQWVPWVHRDDVLGLIQLALTNPAVSGPVNVVAPEPVTGREFAQTLGQVLHRPAGVPVPLVALRLLLGEFADYLVASQRVVPQRAQMLGYRFQYPVLAGALENLIV